MKTKPFLLTILFATILISCGQQKDEATDQETSTTIYFNGDIITMEGDSPQYAEAVVEQDGKIAFVGSLKDAENMFTSSSKYNLEGKTMLPGFIDGHGHIYNVGLLSGLAANILPAPDGPGTNFDEMVEAVKAWVNTEKGEFIINKFGMIIANGYDDSQLEERAHPTKEVLDRISTDLPVVLIHQSGHLACVNSKALEVFGLTKDSPNVEGGLMRRNQNGEPNGILEEAAFFNPVMPIVGKADEEVQMRCVQSGQEEYAKFGYTTAQDGRSTIDVTTALSKAAETGKLFIDVVAYPDIIWNKDAMNSVYYTKDKSYQNHYRIGGVKLTLDGSPQGKTAWLSKCYHANPEGQEGCYKGYPILEDDKAIEYITMAFENDWQIMCHTNGDAAIDQFIKGVQAAVNTTDKQDHRSVLIHGQTLRKDQIPSLTGLDIYPSLFPMHTYYWGDWHRESVLGEERAAYISPARDVIDAGRTITSHHDAPVTFPNSLRVLDATVNRVTRSGFILGPDQRITVYEGLKSLTDWAAIQHFEENTKGTLATGKLADFVILDKNPLKIDPMHIHEITVIQTIKEGKTVYQKQNLAGGWQEVDMEDDVKEALDFALKEISPVAKLKRLISAKKQVVKGLNYDLTLALEDGATWNVIVYRDLEGKLSLTKKTKSPMPGGWMETEITPEVEEAVDFILSRMNNASPLKEIVSAKSQVVKGINYEVTFSLENNTIWTGKVNRDLDGKYSIIEEVKRKN